MEDKRGDGVEGRREEEGPRPPFVSPFLPNYQQEEEARPKGLPRMSWGTSSLGQSLLFAAVVAVMLMIIDLKGLFVARFSFVWVCGPVVGIALIVMAIKIVQYLRERASYRSDLPFEPREPLSWRHTRDEEKK
jgi:hypothetical protein